MSILIWGLFGSFSCPWNNSWDLSINELGKSTSLLFISLGFSHIYLPCMCFSFPCLLEYVFVHDVKFPHFVAFLNLGLHLGASHSGIKSRIIGL